MNDPEDIRVQLARMEGKQDLANERLDTANKINDERHAATKTQLAALDNRMNSHGDRISGLEKREFGRDSGDKRISAAGKTLWLAIGSIPGGLVVAVLMKAFGL